MDLICLALGDDSQDFLPVAFDCHKLNIHCVTLSSQKRHLVQSKRIDFQLYVTSADFLRITVVKY